MLLQAPSKFKDRNALGLVLLSGPDSARGVEVLAAVHRAEPLSAAAVIAGREFGPAPRAQLAHRAFLRCFRWTSMSCMTSFASVFRSAVQKSSSSHFRSPKSPQALERCMRVILALKSRSRPRSAACRRRASRSGVSTTRRISPGGYTASSRLIPSRVTWSQAAEPQAGTDRITGMRIGSRLDVCYRADYVRFTSRSRHSGQGWECLKLTQSGHSTNAASGIFV